jgi:hypothetical protein
VRCPWKVVGGGLVDVVSIDPGNATATLRFASHMGRRFVAGGEGDDGRLFVYAYGHVTVVPKGDPYEGELQAALRLMERVSTQRQSIIEESPDRAAVPSRATPPKRRSDRASPDP